MKNTDNLLGPILDTTDPRFVRRLAKAINAECGMNGFYSSFGMTSEMGGGSRKFFGFVKVVKGRLMAREVTGSDQWGIDLTGVESVEGNGNGRVSASRYLKYPNG